jgi:hypothetical protein
MIGQLNVIYSEKCREHFLALTAIVEHVLAIQTAVAAFKNRISKKGRSHPGTSCYACRTTYIRNCLTFLAKAAEALDFQSMEVIELLIEFANTHTVFATTAVDTLVAFSRANFALSKPLVSAFVSALPDVSPQMRRLLCEIGRIKDRYVHERLRLLTQTIEAAMQFADSSASFVPVVVEPLLRVVCDSPCVIRDAQRKLLSAVFAGWSHRSPVMSDLFDLILSREFATVLFLTSSSKKIRSVLAAAYQVAASLGHFKEVALLITNHIRKSLSFRLKHQDCYAVLRFLLKNPIFLNSTFHDGFFDHLCELLVIEVDRVVALESIAFLDVSIGISTMTIASILHEYLSNVIIFRHFIRTHDAHLLLIVKSFIKLGRLLLQGGHRLDVTIDHLSFILDRCGQEELIFESLEIPIALLNNYGR